MKKWYLCVMLLFFCQAFFAQEKDEELEQEPISLFTDFRIPMRENINESDLKYNGWRTDPGSYTFRCRNKKRIRLTLWHLEGGPNKEAIGSEFVNITPAIGKCNKKDLKYNTYHYKEKF
ncbi:hypothetical protein [Wenyingzhuangia sp. IMCC45574]